MTIFLLPNITYIISKAISGNIALSLGMVGALSIVRFRNPVRSSAELTIYFFLITAGIAHMVSYVYLYYLLAIFLLITIILKILKNKIFNSSFNSVNNEDNYSIVEYRAKKIDINDFSDTPLLYFYSDKKESICNLGFVNQKKANIFIEKYINDPNTLSITLTNK